MEMYSGETNGLINAQAYHDARHNGGDIETVDWTEPGLRITRLRLLTDRGFPMYDVSYCHGMVGDRHVDVQLPFHQLEKRRWKSDVLWYAKRDRVYAKGLGIFRGDVVSTLV